MGDLYLDLGGARLEREARRRREEVEECQMRSQIETIYASAEKLSLLSEFDPQEVLRKLADKYRPPSDRSPKSPAVIVRMAA